MKGNERMTKDEQEGKMKKGKINKIQRGRGKKIIRDTFMRNSIMK